MWTVTWAFYSQGMISTYWAQGVWGNVLLWALWLLVVAFFASSLIYNCCVSMSKYLQTKDHFDGSVLLLTFFYVNIGIRSYGCCSSTYHYIRRWCMLIFFEINIVRYLYVIGYVNWDMTFEHVRDNCWFLSRWL